MHGCHAVCRALVIMPSRSDHPPSAEVQMVLSTACRPNLSLQRLLVCPPRTPAGLALLLVVQRAPTDSAIAIEGAPLSMHISHASWPMTWRIIAADFFRIPDVPRPAAMNPTLLQRPITPLLVGVHQGAGNPSPSAMHSAVHAARYKVVHALILHLRYCSVSKEQSLLMLEPMRGLASCEEEIGNGWQGGQLPSRCPLPQAKRFALLAAPVHATANIEQWCG